MNKDDNLNLSDAEKVAKKFILNVIFKGGLQSELCDTKFENEKFKLPAFYDDVKFKRGQKYFANNHFGIIRSHLGGLFSLICEPAGATALDKTNNSSSPSKARKRYIDTGLHLSSWCTHDLKPGSRSWESLKTVRKMHLAASNAALVRNELGLPQAALAFTTFGFMGYALVKPHYLGIKYDCDADREAYVHMWAVICSMLGIKDEFNICLHPLNVVEIICHILLRYHFIPFLQMDTKVFQKLGRAFVDGMMPFVTYESMLFLARRLAGVPGYQYKVDISKEYHLRQIFTEAELKRLKDEFQNDKGFEYRKGLIFDEKWHLINVKQVRSNDENNLNKDYNHLLNFYELKYPAKLEVIEVEDKNIESYLNDDKFKDLSKYDQFLVWIMIQVENLQNSWIKLMFQYFAMSMLYVFKFAEGLTKYGYKAKYFKH